MPMDINDKARLTGAPAGGLLHFNAVMMLGLRTGNTPILKATFDAQAQAATAQEATEQLRRDKEVLVADLNDAKRSLRQQHDRCSKLEVSACLKVHVRPLLTCPPCAKSSEQPSAPSPCAVTQQGAGDPCAALRPRRFRSLRSTSATNRADPIL